MVIKMNNENEIYYNQKIECNVEDCKYCDCDKKCCSLSKIEVGKDNKHTLRSDNTLCSSYECKM